MLEGANTRGGAAALKAGPPHAARKKSVHAKAGLANQRVATREVGG
jgi:hypothetical protein